jgi:hypothetical protein
MFFYSSLFVTAQNNSTLYSFFVAGHTYGNAGVNNNGFHPPFKNKFGYLQNRTEIKFGVLVGDIVSPNPIAQDWDEIDIDIDSLGLPVYFAVGNHDMENRPLFESRYGNTYFDFINSNDLFIVLDPNISGWSIKGAQLQYLKDLLSSKASSVDNIFVFFHQVIWRESNNGFNHILINSNAGRLSPVNFWSEIEPLFSKLSNDVVMFSGDVGVSWASDVSFDINNNITFITTGMGDEDGENFVVVNVDTSKSLDYDLICLSDSELECLGDIEDYTVVNEPAGFNFLYYRNACKTTFNVNIYSKILKIKSDSIERITIQLYDLQGKIVLEKYLEGDIQYDLDVSNLSKGFYALKIIENKECPAIKFFVD